MNALLSISNLSVGYGHVGVLSGVSLEVRPGTIVALVGSNGAGKTTLLRAVSGLLKPSAGEIRFEGKRLDGLRPGAVVAAGVLHVAEGRRLFRTQSVLDNLLLGLYGLRLSASERQARLDSVYELFPVLKDRLRAVAGILSGGQQQMLAIAQALVRSRKLLLLDEPSIGLAPSVIDQVFDVVERIRAQGTTVLLVEQMVERALQIADHAYVLQNGVVAGNGPAHALMDSELVRKAYFGAAAIPPEALGASTNGRPSN